MKNHKTIAKLIALHLGQQWRVIPSKNAWKEGQNFYLCDDDKHKILFAFDYFKASRRNQPRISIAAGDNFCCPTITVDYTRAPIDLVRDIEKRFMPEYFRRFALWQKNQEKNSQQTEKALWVAQAIANVSNGRQNGGLKRGNGQEVIRFYNKGYEGHEMFTVYGYNGGTTIRADNLCMTPEQAIKIAAILVE